MSLLTVFLFFTFGQYRTGAVTGYSARFNDASRLKAGDSVRVAGVRVGTVNGVALQPDKKVVVKFDADRSIALTDGTKAAVRYLNLVGDRYLELVDGPGSTRRLAAGGQINVSHTAPALDLDLLLGGLKPLIHGLNPRDVNALSSALLEVLQGEGGSLQSLFNKSTSFTNTLADNDQTIEHLIDNLNAVAATLNKDGGQFSGAIDRLQRLVAIWAPRHQPLEPIDCGEVAAVLVEGGHDGVQVLNQLLDRLVVVAQCIRERRRLENSDCKVPPSPWNTCNNADESALTSCAFKP